MKETNNSEPLGLDHDDQSEDWLNIDDQDLACIFFPDLNYEAQLHAIADLLSRNSEAEKRLSEEIKEIETIAQKTSGIRNQYMVDEWVDRLASSVYQDAAHSMAAVGMLAPFIESIFYQGFLKIGECYALRSGHLPTHPRWHDAGRDQWDCHYFWSKGVRAKNLVEGIFQLADAIGLSPHLPTNMKPVLKALFMYRNKMFHHGFEWPVEERLKFANFLKNEKLPDLWFRAATSDGEPWVFYMTEEYISECLSLINQIFFAFGRFARELTSEQVDELFKAPQ